jgi:hypothetical protein
MKVQLYRLYRLVGLILLVFGFAFQGSLEAVFAGGAAGAKKPPKPQYVVKSQLLTPVRDDRAPVPLVTNGGWPLTLRFSMDLSLPGRGIIFNELEQFPKGGDTGWAVFADPDGCPSFMCHELMVGENLTISCPSVAEGIACPPKAGVMPPADETAVQFTNNMSQPGADQTGASSLLPSLVLLADRGKGVIVGDAPLFQDLGRKNLAAQVNSVSYALADDCPIDGPCQTSIVAHTLVPRSLLLPQIYIDQAYGVSCPVDISSPQQAAYLEVGGTLKVLPGEVLASGWESLGISPFVNFLAVLVNGPAPDEVRDWNRDGAVNEKDLVYQGYVLLSDPETFTVEMTFQEYDFLSFAYWNFDGTLEDLDSYVCGIVTPAGSVSRTPPPR